MSAPMAGYFVLLYFVVSTLVVARPPDAKEKGRVYDGKVSDEEHFNEGTHNAEYDHEAFLGNEKRTFDQLTPEESKERLGKLVDRIDKDQDGKVTNEELKDWIKITAKRYIYDDVERQWVHLKKLEAGTLSMVEIYNGAFVNLTDPISWEKYKNWTYGYITEEDQFDYKDMVRRDRRRWERADLDKNDELTKEEFTAFLHPEEYDHMKDVVVDETLEDIDKDKDGALSLDEYLGDLYPESEKEENKEEPEWIKTEREHFNDYRDKNKDGKMDRDEVREWIIPTDYDHIDAEARHLIHEADANQDKVLTKEEIVEKHDVFVGSQATEYGEALARHDEF